MSYELPPLSQEDRAKFDKIDQESIDFLMTRYNKVNRLVIADMIRRSCYHHGDKIALIDGDLSRTYGQLEDEINQTAQALLDLGVKKYDRVAILAHNTHHHVLTWLGCAKIGAIYLAVNYLLRGPDISYCINHSESVVFIIEDTLFDLVKDVLGEMPSVKTYLWSNTTGQGGRPDNFLDFDRWRTAAPATEPDVVLRIEDPAQMTYTSGTESRPKGVIISNQALIAQYLGCIIDGGYDANDINVNALPIYHCAARDVFLNPVFWIGGTNVLMAPDLGAILANIAKYKATMFFAPPTVWIGLLRHPEFEKQDLTSLKKAYYGASIMPVKVLQELQERLPGVKIYNYYGQTELAPYHTILKAEDALIKLGSAGRAGLHMESRLEDAMRGGWFHSGDLGVLDQDRYITVVDRKKDMIKTGGENVASREVEEAIYLDARVEETAVIGVDHPKWVEAVTALVKVKAGQTITEEELIEHCRRHLAPFKVPKRILFVDALPKTPTGKILKREMRVTYQGLFD